MKTLIFWGTFVRDLNKLTLFTVLLTLLYTANQAILVHTLKPISEDFITLQLFADSTMFSEIISQWTGQQRQIFLDHFLYDSYHPLIYGTALIFGMAYAFNYNDISSKFNAAVFLPVIASFCDLIENATHYFYVTNPTLISDSLILFSKSVTYLKWGIAILSLSIIVLCYAGVMSTTRSSPK